MAMIRVTRCVIQEKGREDEIVLNTTHIEFAYPDKETPCRGVWVQMVTNEPLLIRMTFDEFWQLMQRET